MTKENNIQDPFLSDRTPVLLEYRLLVIERWQIASCLLYSREKEKKEIKSHP